MNRLEELTRDLRDRGVKPVVPFLTAGFPTPRLFSPILAALARRGCSLVEVGIPFSDPVADGPVIQAASQRALAAGASLRHSLDLAADARRDHGQHVVLMGYLNPILKMGAADFVASCAAARIAGVIVPDLPLEESAPLQVLLNDVGIDLVSLVAPTTDNERLAHYAAKASGFLYLVSTTGVTGAGASRTDHLEDYVARVRGCCDLPLYVGFGIGNPAQASRVAAVADGAIVGTALLRTIEDNLAQDPAAAAGNFVGNLAAAMNPGKGDTQ